jgi:hypothetical protein
MLWVACLAMNSVKRLLYMTLFQNELWNARF